MKTKPFSPVPGLAENTYVYVFNYAGSEIDFVADKAAYLAELDKHFAGSSAYTGMKENGIAVTGTAVAGVDLTVGSSGNNATIAIGAGAVVTTAMQYGSESAKKIIPIVLYKGSAVPFSDYVLIDEATSKITLKNSVINVPYSTTSAVDYIIYWSDHLSGYLVSIEAPNISLPIESSSFSAVGHSEPVIKITKRGEPEATGSLTVMEHMTAFMDSTNALLNVPGEELLYRIYGPDWTTPSNAGYTQSLWNTLKAPTRPFGIAILTVTGNPFDGGSTAYQNKLWGTMNFIYHCKVTSIGPKQNISNDSTDPILRTVEFTCAWPDQNAQTSILCGV